MKNSPPPMKIPMKTNGETKTIAEKKKTPMKTNAETKTVAEKKKTPMKTTAERKTVAEKKKTPMKTTAELKKRSYDLMKSPSRSTSPMSSPAKSIRSTKSPSRSTSPMSSPAKPTRSTKSPFRSTLPMKSPSGSTSPMSSPARSTRPTKYPARSTRPTNSPARSTSPTNSPARSTSPTNSQANSISPMNSPVVKRERMSESELEEAQDEVDDELYSLYKKRDWKPQLYWAEVSTLDQAVRKVNRGNLKKRPITFLFVNGPISVYKEIDSLVGPHGIVCTRVNAPVLQVMNSEMVRYFVERFNSSNQLIHFFICPSITHPQHVETIRRELARWTVSGVTEFAV